LSKKLAEHNPGRKIFSSKIATTVVWIITIIWTVPTLGLLVTSFKTNEKILNEAWWTSLLNPDFTLENYKGVFLGDGTASLSTGVLPYFVNSIVITLPAQSSRLLLQPWPPTHLRGSASAAATSSFSQYLPYKSCLCRCR
jgi:ABC-type glycerol-3-phosphate transport system permease component